jgi:hypothetical protein
MEASLQPAQTNPLEIVEDLVVENDWLAERADEHELVIQMPGRWCDYKLLFVWQQAEHALHFCCRVAMKLEPSAQDRLNALLARINEKMWVGHFDIAREEKTILFRHTTLLRGIGTISAEIIEDLIELGVMEADRYFPAFQLIVWGGKSIDEALAAAILEPVGEA